MKIEYKYREAEVHAKKIIPVVRIVNYRISKVKRLVVWQKNAPQLQAIANLIFEGQTPD